LAPTSVVVFNIARMLYKRLPTRYRPLSPILSEFLPLPEAVSLLDERANGANGDISEGDWDMGHEWKKAQWKKGILVVPAVLETLYWFVRSCRLVVTLSGNHSHNGHDEAASHGVVMTVLLTLSWLYASLRPLFLNKRALTAPYDLFTLYLSILFVTCLNVAAMLYKQYIGDGLALRTSHGTALTWTAHILFLCVLLGTTLSLPIGVPPRGVDIEKIGTSITPEDYTSLAGWITFWWIYPIIKRVSFPCCSPLQLLKIASGDWSNDE